MQGKKPNPQQAQQNKKKGPSPKKVMIGCTGCGGASVIFFVILALIFVGQTSATGENPIAGALGVQTGVLINSLITLVNLIFGGVALLLFITGIIGVFQYFMARKDDKKTKKNATLLSIISISVLIITIIMWIVAFLYMDSRRVPVDDTTVSGIITEPANTLGLTAPISITFDATNLPINSRQYEILTYAWDFGDGNTSTVPLTSNVYTDKGANNGRFDVRLQVTKRDVTTSEESVDTFTETVTISNVELGAVFTATPAKGPAPLEVEFDASASAAPAGEIVSYEWDFNNDNVFDDATGQIVSNTFDQLGTYTVNLRVVDNTGQSKVASQTVEVSSDSAPSAVITIPTDDGNYYVGQQYSFRAERSTSPNGEIVKYEWDFGDGTSKANTRTASHSYDEPGEYEVYLKVTDEEGAIGESREIIEVEMAESAPIPVISTTPEIDEETGKLEGTLPLEIAFNASNSKDADDNIVDYSWDFDGDGTEDAAGETATFVYKQAGIYNATLTVTDSENNEANAILVIQVGQQPLQARITAEPVEGVAPLTVTFDASGSSYPEGQIVSYEWNFGDGSPKRIDTSKVTYKYTKIGTFTASVTAIASDNTRSTAEIPVSVRPVALTACFTATPESGEAPLDVQFDPNCSTGTVTKYAWNFGDGTSSRSRKPVHEYTNPGNYSVVLEVTDNQNVVNTFTKNILVTGSL
ncbi:PKD domain-containing protein [Candidatus Peregrinibacteria bacterium]|nr:PKD domain-containing protein [Candidatus Peregrinibacteria bacterium]